MEEQKIPEVAVENEKKPPKIKIKLIIIISAIVAVLLIVCPILIGLLTPKPEGETFPPVDPSLLEDTKEEGFDIMEYEEYTSLNRVVMLENKGMGTSISIDDSTYKNYDPAIELVYEMLNILIAGDFEAYNAMVSEEAGRFEWFSQQQTCPVDRSVVTVAHLRPVPRIMRNMLSKLQIACDNAVFGCSAIVRLDNLMSHLSDCEHNPKRPVTCEQGCG